MKASRSAPTSLPMATMCWRPSCCGARTTRRTGIVSRCEPTANDRWEASFVPARIGRHRFTVQAWWDAWGTFRHDLSAKHAAGQTVTLEIEEGLPHDRGGGRPCADMPARRLPLSPNACSHWTPRTGRAAAGRGHGRGDACGSTTGRLPPNMRRRSRSMSIVRRPASRAGTRCFPAPPRTIRRGTARSPM